MLFVLSIRQRIWGGFIALVIVFIVNGIITIATLHNSKVLSNYISTVIDPSQQYLQDFRAIIIESKMYTTNWVFLRSEMDDKTSLQQLHSQAYPTLRRKILDNLNHLNEKKMEDSLNHILKDYEQLILVQKDVMKRLEKFQDYDDPVKKMLSEQIIEDEVIPRTALILSTLNRIAGEANSIKEHHYNRLEAYSMRLQIFIPLLSVLMIVLGVIMSMYFTKIITHPLKKIERIIKDLGRGVVNKVSHDESHDEIGLMITSVNNLSDKLRQTASFAQEVGNRNYAVPFSPLSDEDILGKSLIAMRDNIRASEAILIETNAELKKSNSELDKFVYSVSHDLRAPLSSMLGVVSLIEAETTEKEIQEDIILLKNSIYKLDGFISDILDYSRNSRMEIQSEKIEFDTTLVDIRNNLKHMASSNSLVQIRTNIDEEYSFYSDKTRLYIILNNLISNAMRYSDPYAQEPYVRVDISTCENMATITIEDNGIGIAEDNQSKVFNMFYRVSKKSVGSGLGLYIVKETVEKLHGEIHFTSQLGKGTKFTITLPNLLKSK